MLFKFIFFYVYGCFAQELRDLRDSEHRQDSQVTFLQGSRIDDVPEARDRGPEQQFFAVNICKETVGAKACVTL